MPMSADELRKLATSYAPVHGRKGKGKKKSTKAAKPMRGARAGYTPIQNKHDVWSHRDLAR